MTFQDYPTKTEAEQEAEEYATPLDQLINPSDVQDDAESWNDIDDERIRSECAECAEVVATEHDYVRNLIKDRAFRIWTDGFRRVSRDVLGDASDDELIHVFNIWPNDMRRGTAYRIAARVFEDPNCLIPQDCYTQAREEVTAGLMEGTKPEL